MSRHDSDEAFAIFYAEVQRIKGSLLRPANRLAAQRSAARDYLRSRSADHPDWIAKRITPRDTEVMRTYRATDTSHAPHPGPPHTGLGHPLPNGARR